MRTREEALSYGLSFPDTYQDAPFHDEVAVGSPARVIKTLDANRFEQ